MTIVPAYRVHNQSLSLSKTHLYKPIQRSNTHSTSHRILSSTHTDTFNEASWRSTNRPISVGDKDMCLFFPFQRWRVCYIICLLLRVSFFQTRLSALWIVWTPFSHWPEGSTRSTGRIETQTMTSSTRTSSGKWRFLTWEVLHWKTECGCELLCHLKEIFSEIQNVPY